jgi:starch phosphorylase
MDGWWVEGAVEGVTGWSIDAQTGGDDERTADAVYTLLQHTIVPAYARDRERYLAVMRGAIAFNASHFNAQRMLAQYAIEAYTHVPANTSSDTAATHRLAI